MDEMQKHLAEAQAEIARLKDEIKELIKPRILSLYFLLRTTPL
jgi:hypothetical protein